MSSTPAPVRRLHNDIHRLHRAERARDHVSHEFHKDKRELKQDHRHVEHVRDVFEGNKKEVKADRKSLGDLREKAATRLDAFDQKEAELQAQVDASIDPLTGQADPFLQWQLDGVEQREADVMGGFDARIGDKRAGLDKTLAAIDRQRTDIKDTRKDIKAERRDVKKESRALDHARDRVKGARHRALKDLLPAEYKMGLKATNRARHELGLKPVHHVIRPGQISAHGKAQMQNLLEIARRNASGNAPGGWCLKAVEDYLAQTSYGKIGHENIPRFGYAHEFADYLNAGKRYERMGLQKLNIDNPYDAPPGSIIVVRAGTPGTSHPTAGDIVVKGYGDTFYNDGMMGYGGSGNFPKGNNYVLGIYAPK